MNHPLVPGDSFFDKIGIASVAGTYTIKMLAFIQVTTINESLTALLTCFSIAYMMIKFVNEYRIFRKGGKSDKH